MDRQKNTGAGVQCFKRSLRNGFCGLKRRINRRSGADIRNEQIRFQCKRRHLPAIEPIQRSAAGGGCTDPRLRQHQSRQAFPQRAAQGRRRQGTVPSGANAAAAPFGGAAVIIRNGQRRRRAAVQKRMQIRRICCGEGISGGNSRKAEPIDQDQNKRIPHHGHSFLKMFVSYQKGVKKTIGKGRNRSFPIAFFV